MFEDGQILYFDPFYFKNGNTAKAKYFVVLKVCDEQKCILASLPTRKETIPRNEVIESGCLELPEISLNCFVIAPDEVVTECGKRFDFKTHLYGHQIDDYESSVLRETYQIEGTDYFIWGKMEASIFKRLVDCFTNSTSVKRKFKRLLG